MADSNLTNLTSASPLSGAETTYIVQSGNSRKTTVQDVSNLATQTALNAKENTLNSDQKRKVTISTLSTTGGSDGDIWLQYTP